MLTPEEVKLLTEIQAKRDIAERHAEELKTLCVKLKSLISPESGLIYRASQAKRHAGLALKKIRAVEANVYTAEQWCEVEATREKMSVGSRLEVCEFRGPQRKKKRQ